MIAPQDLNAQCRISWARNGPKKQDRIAFTRDRCLSDYPMVDLFLDFIGLFERTSEFKPDSVPIERTKRTRYSTKVENLIFRALSLLTRSLCGSFVHAQSVDVRFVH